VHAGQSYFLGFQGLTQTINTGGSITLSSPSAIVVDPAGDIFIADTVGGSGRIVEVNAQGAASVLTIGTALGSLAGIAIDGAGNLYIVDNTNKQLVKVSSSGGAGSVISTGAVTLTAPQGVAVDQFGDIFISDSALGIVEVPSAGTAATLAVTGLTSPTTLNSPEGLAVDTGGNLYIADSANSRIVKVAAGGTTGTVVSISSGPTLSTPSDVAVDRTGNIFICDQDGDYARIVEVDTSGKGYVLSPTGISLSPAAAGVALDVFGTVYIADTGNSQALVVDPLLTTDSTAGTYASSGNKSVVGFGHITLGSSTPVTLTLPFTTGTSTGLGGVKVFTSGAPGLDFQIVSGANTTCNSSTTSSSSCTVEVSFLPTAPGLRNGAVVLYDTDMNPIVALPLYGWGDAPVAALNPNIGAVISTGTLTIANPYEIALDGAGNLYLGVYSSSQAVKIPAGGGSATPVTLGSPGSTAVRNITGVALDGAGNLFIGDHENSRVLVVTPGGVVSVLNISGLGSTPLGFPTALAFDAAGNLYIADFTNGRIVEVSSVKVTGATSTGIATVISTGNYSFGDGNLTGMTVDSMGNIYAAARTQNNSKIVEVTAAGVVSLLSIPSNITPAISNPQGVGVDAMGNVYIVDTTNNRIVRITSAGVATALGVTGLPSPSATLGPTLFGVTVDPAGNLYISDWTNNRVVFVNVSGSALTFPSTAQGATSAAKTATVTNLGNQSLIFSANPTYTANFSNNSADTNSCTSSTSLLAGIACDVSVQFTPQSVGSLSAGVTVTNNTLNVAGSTQQVSVSGTSFSPSDTTSSAVTISPTSLVRGQPATITATVSDTATGHTSIIPTGTVSFTDTVGSTLTTLNNGSPVTLSAGKATLSGVVLAGIGTHTITANYAGVSGTYATSSNTTTATLNKASVTVTGPTTQPVTVTIGQTSSATVTVTAPYTTISAPSGTVSYSILNSSGTSVASGTLTLTAGSGSSSASIPIPSTLASGSYTISVTYSGDSNYQVSATAQVTLTVSQATTSISLVSSLNPVLVTSPVTFTATVASSAGTPTGFVSFYDGTTLLSAATLSSGAASLTTSSLAVGTHSIAAVYSGNSNFASAISSAVTEVVQDFSLSASGGGGGSGGSGGSSGGSSAPTQTVLPGETATYSLALVPNVGTTFPVPITLSVSGLPPGATATVSPQIIPANTVIPNIILSIQLPTSTASLVEKHAPNRQIPPVLWGILLLPLAAKLRRVSKRLANRIAMLLLLAMGVVIGAGLSSCGSSNGFFGQQQQTYTVIVTATAGTTSRATSVTLTVE
jgi:sugar lactone lactonase YvrE